MDDENPPIVTDETRLLDLKAENDLLYRERDISRAEIARLRAKNDALKAQRDEARSTKVEKDIECMCLWEAIWKAERLVKDLREKYKRRAIAKQKERWNGNV